MLISKDDELLKILNGESLRLHPQNRLKILDISSNICFNQAVRLVAEGLDINALYYEEVPVEELLAGRDIYDRYSFKVEIKRHNEDMGSVDIIIEPSVEDWLDKADRSIGGERKVAVLEQAVKFLPDDRRIKDRLVKEYISIKRWEAAAVMLEEMANEDVPEKAVLFKLLEVYESMHNIDGAVTVLRRIIDLDPDDVDIRLRLAEVLEKSGRETDAIKMYEGLLNRMEKKELLPIYKALGFLYSKNKQIDKAISSYLSALEMDKDDINLYYNLSLLYEQIGQKDKSDSFLRKAVNLRADDTEGRLRLSKSLIDKGRLDDAETYLKEVLKNEPKSLEAWLLMMRIAEKRENKNALKTAYENILALDPQNKNVIYNLGIIEYETGNFARAQTYLEKYIKMSPRDTDARTFLFDIYRKQKKEDLAFKEAGAIVRLKPKETDYYHYMFEYLNNRGNYEGIINVMEDALKNNPKDNDFRKYLVFAYLKTEKEGLAVEKIKEVLKSSPDDITMLLQLARLEEKRGNYEEALSAYKKVIDISPSHEEAGDAYLRLRIEVLPGTNER